MDDSYQCSTDGEIFLSFTEIDADIFYFWIDG